MLRSRGLTPGLLKELFKQAIKIAINTSLLSKNGGFIRHFYYLCSNKLYHAQHPGLFLQAGRFSSQRSL